jgi:hypothetical protein
LFPSASNGCVEDVPTTIVAVVADIEANVVEGGAVPADIVDNINAASGNAVNILSLNIEANETKEVPIKTTFNDLMELLGFGDKSYNEEDNNAVSGRKEESFTLKDFV